MLSDMKQRAQKAGLSPGTVVFTGERRTEHARVTLTEFDQSTLKDEEVIRVEELANCRTSTTVSWIDVAGLHDVDLLTHVGGLFGIHPLVLEDIAHPGQRAKLEVHEEHLFIVLRAITPAPEPGLEPESEQISLIVGQNYLLTFQERPSSVFDSVRQRIQTSRGRVRHMGVDYLAYALLDAVVDQYFVVLEDIGEALEALEDRLLIDPDPECLEMLHDQRKPVMAIRRAAWPIREILSVLMRGDSSVFHPSTLPYLHDLQDHTLHVMDTVEDFRDLQTSLMQLYLSSSSQRTSEVTKVLTIIATVFIPLTFLAGVYGMNFEHMPELNWRWSYPLFWLAIVLVTGVQVYFMRRKRWV